MTPFHNDDEETAMNLIRKGSPARTERANRLR